MADQESRPRTIRESTVNWSGVIVGGILLVLIVGAVHSILIRCVATAVAFAVTVYASQRWEEREIENPILRQIRQKRPGLDRRKYGRLRAATDDLLQQIREMNRVAVDARSGKISQRHAHVELDRVADKMRGLVSVIRKAAGVPTPVRDAPSPAASAAGRGNGPPRPRPVPRKAATGRPDTGPAPSPTPRRPDSAPATGTDA